MSTVYRITGAQAVTRILAGIAIGAFILVLLSLLWKPQRVEPYVEPEDGIVPSDPYLVALAAAQSGTLRAWHIRDMALDAADRA